MSFQLRMESFNFYIQPKDFLTNSWGDETAKHVNFVQSMLLSYSSLYFSSLEGDIRKVSKISTTGNYFETGFHPISTCRPA